MKCVTISDKGEEIFLFFRNVETGFQARLAFYLACTGAFPRGLTRLGHEANHLPLVPRLRIC